LRKHELSAGTRSGQEDIDGVVGKKVRKNSMTSSCCVVLQSGALEMIAEIEACRLHLQEGDKLTPLANARYCLNNNPAQTLKILKATHYSSERWANSADKEHVRPLASYSLSIFASNI
jgi:signal transduction protein PmrD